MNHIPQQKKNALTQLLNVPCPYNIEEQHRIIDHTIEQNSSSKDAPYLISMLVSLKAGCPLTKEQIEKLIKECDKDIKKHLENSQRINESSTALKRARPVTLTNLREAIWSAFVTARLAASNEATLLRLAHQPQSTFGRIKEKIIKGSKGILLLVVGIPLAVVTRIVDLVMRVVLGVAIVGSAVLGVFAAPVLLMAIADIPSALYSGLKRLFSGLDKRKTRFLFTLREQNSENEMAYLVKNRERMAAFLVRHPTLEVLSFQEVTVERTSLSDSRKEVAKRGYQTKMEGTSRFFTPKQNWPKGTQADDTNEQKIYVEFKPNQG